jgi:hypothetical protein
MNLDDLLTDDLLSNIFLQLPAKTLYQLENTQFYNKIINNASFWNKKIKLLTSINYIKKQENRKWIDHYRNIEYYHHCKINNIAMFNINLIDRVNYLLKIMPVISLQKFKYDQDDEEYDIESDILYYGQNEDLDYEILRSDDVIYVDSPKYKQYYKEWQTILNKKLITTQKITIIYNKKYKNPKLSTEYIETEAKKDIILIDHNMYVSDLIDATVGLIDTIDISKEFYIRQFEVYWVFGEKQENPVIKLYRAI